MSVLRGYMARLYWVLRGCITCLFFVGVLRGNFA